MPWREVPAFMELLTEQSGIAASALAFLILNAARTGEVIGARWSEIDFDKSTWTVPAAQMKTHIEHRKPLNEACLSLLRKLPVLCDDF